MRRATLLALLLLGCSDNDGAKRVLESQGYSHVETTGFAWFGCGQDDDVSTGFRAKSPTGQPVEGVVCCGLLFKGCTVRFEAKEAGK